MLLPVSLALVLLGAACSGGDEAADSATGTTAAAATAAQNGNGAEAETTSSTSADQGETAPEETAPDETAPNETASDETDEGDVAALCDGYLTYVATRNVDDLAAQLGSTAPPEVAAALDLVQSDDVRFLDLLNAVESLRDYVAPICRSRWDEDLVPAATDQDAVDGFFNALVEGDRSAAANVAPDDVIATFEPWEPIEPDPDLGPASLLYEGGGDFSMLLGPTLSVFCEVEGAIVTNCLFGE